ncbi:MAG: alpha/beta family hydrolase [Gemmatimonadota bacterium]
MTETVQIELPDGSAAVSGLWSSPSGADLLYVFGHGAGAGMRHPFMETVADRLAGIGVATLRFQFPYMDRGSRRPDPQPLLLDTVRAAVRHARVRCELPLLAGGKSMGGRMTSLAQSQAPLDGVRGLVFFGFPLHPAGRPGTARAAHLAQIEIPMLFLQGSRDALSELELLEPVIEGLKPGATLHVLQGADHGFAVRKKDGRTAEDVLDEAIATFERWRRTT